MRKNPLATGSRSLRSVKRGTPTSMSLWSGPGKAFISCKWALRNDRNHDVVNEGNQYKSAAAGRGLIVEVGAVTNEFGPGRIARVLDSQLIDFVAHTNRDLR